MYNHLLLEQGCILGDDMGLGKTVQVSCIFISSFLECTECRNHSSYRVPHLEA